MCVTSKKQRDQVACLKHSGTLFTELNKNYKGEKLYDKGK